MNIWKILALVLITVGAIASAQAMDVKMYSQPYNTMAPGEDFLVYGYIYSDNIVDQSDVRLKIYDDADNLVDTYTPHITTLNGEDSAKNVYFYDWIDISSTGNHEIKLKVNGETQETHRINIKSMGAREVKVTNLDYAISGDRIIISMDVENMDNEDHDVKVYLYGERNFDSPKSFEMELDADEQDEVTKTYALSDFGSQNFILVAEAKTDSGNVEGYGTPDYDFVDSDEYGNYYYDYSYDYGYNYDYNEYYYDYPSYPRYGGNVIITGIELNTQVFYAGDVVEGTAYLKNVGSSESQYKFEYIYNNQAFKMGDVNYILPGETATQNIAIEVPDADSFKLTAKATSGTVDTEERTYMISHRLKYFMPYVSSETLYLNAEQNATLNLTIKNMGTEDDSYKVTVSGWGFYKIAQDSFALSAGSQKVVPITIEVPATADMDKYTITVDVANADNVHKTRTVKLSVIQPESRQSEVVFNDSVENQYFEENETVTYAIKVTNLETAEKDYFVEADAGNATVDVSYAAFALEQGDTKEVKIAVTPSDKETHAVAMKIYANGELIFNDEVDLQYTADKQKAISGMTGFAIFEGKAWMPAVYMLALIGVITIGYIGYRVVNEKAKTEAVVQYNETQKANVKPSDEVRRTSTQTSPQLTPEQIRMQNYMNQWPREQMPADEFQRNSAPRLQPKTDYPEDSFMRRF